MNSHIYNLQERTECNKVEPKLRLWVINYEITDIAKGAAVVKANNAKEAANILLADSQFNAYRSVFNIIRIEEILTDGMDINVAAEEWIEFNSNSTMPPSSIEASKIIYIPSNGMNSRNVQGAIDELNSNIKNIDITPDGDLSEIPEVIDKEIYYNDGSNEVVPIKHPDLSTQPSILPYKFMGQYVYEQLIPKSSFTYLGSSHEVYLENANLGVSNPIILEACLIYSSGILYSNVTIYNGRLIWQCPSPEVSDFLFAKIIYTSMSEEGEEYYYYNESVGFDKYVKLYGESNFLINQGVIFNCAQPEIHNGMNMEYAYPTDDNNVFTFTLTEDYFNFGIPSINCYIETDFYADIYILNELIATYELSANNYIELDRSDYRNAILNKQLRIVVRAR